MIKMIKYTLSPLKGLPTTKEVIQDEYGLKVQYTLSDMNTGEEIARTDNYFELKRLASKINPNTKKKTYRTVTVDPQEDECLRKEAAKARISISAYMTESPYALYKVINILPNTRPICIQTDGRSDWTCRKDGILQTYMDMIVTNIMPVAATPFPNETLGIIVTVKDKKDR